MPSSVKASLRAASLSEDSRVITRVLVFSQPCKARLRFQNRGLIANVDGLREHGYRVPDGPSFGSGPGHWINRPICVQEILMAVPWQHGVDHCEVRSRIAKMHVAPINDASNLVMFVNQNLTPVQIAMNERTAR